MLVVMMAMMTGMMMAMLSVAISLADRNETRLVWKCDFYICDIDFNCGALKCKWRPKMRLK